MAEKERVGLRVAKNSSVILSGKIISKLISLAAVICISDLLGSEGFGQFSFILVYLGFFSIFSDLGLTTIMVRESSRDQNAMSHVMGSGLLLKIFLSISSLVLAIITALLFPPAHNILFVLFIGCIVILTYFSTGYEVPFRVNLRMLAPISIDLGKNLIFALTAVFLFFSEYRSSDLLLILIIVWVVLSVLSSIILASASGKIVKSGFVVDKSMWAKLLKAGLPLGIASLAIMFYYRIDVFMLKGIKGDSAVGLYSSASRISESFSLIPSTLIASIFPLLSSYFQKEQDKFVETIRLSVRLMLVLGLPIGLGATVLRDEIYALIYQPEYEPAASALVSLSWGEVFIFLNVILYNVLAAMDKQRIGMFITLGMLAGNIILNSFLIPHYSYDGAAVATLATEILGLVSLVFVLWRKYSIPVFPAKFFGILVANGVLIGICIICKSMPVLITILIASLIYLGLIWILKVVTLEELRISWKTRESDTSEI